MNITVDSYFGGRKTRYLLIPSYEGHPEVPALIHYSPNMEEEKLRRIGLFGLTEVHGNMVLLYHGVLPLLNYLIYRDGIYSL